PAALESFESKNNPSTESNTSRLLMWSTSIDVFKEFPFAGVGTGDYDDVLTKKNESYGNSGVAMHRYNSHNQFLNTMVQLGLLGLVVLIMLFLNGFKMAYQQKNIIGLFTLSCFFLNFLFESFIESQAGIILFCLLTIAIFYLKPKTNRYHNGLTPIPKENFK
ncbi:O-antigen ligase family protein, partial [Crocinitomicaceae bacterium]|nr:O-antigen ligase family protein [Crocinitomicaceae bacterium]